MSYFLGSPKIESQLWINSQYLIPYVPSKWLIVGLNVIFLALGAVKKSLKASISDSNLILYLTASCVVGNRFSSKSPH